MASARTVAFMKSNLEIAQEAVLKPIGEIADAIGIRPEELEPYGHYKAKVRLSVIDRLKDSPDAKIVCVAGINPTKAGEGKTTTSVSLTQGLGRIGKKPVLCLREASLGPVFGIKGGAAGGGYTQVVPMEDMNLHFTGDTHAVGAANNLLAAMIDSHLLHGNFCNIDPLQITWRRAIDINDRALRDITVGLGGKANGYPRQTGFDITAASEVMAILALSRDISDLRKRLGAITIGYTYDGKPVTAEQIKGAGSMAVLLKDAIKPNLIQTLEGQPVLMHAGPFANIAHGNSSLVADYVGMKLGEYVVTESGFGSDMGMEKFFDIVCRHGKLKPSAVVLVTTVRALKHHGGVESGVDEQQALEEGSENLRRHVGIVKEFGLPCVVAVNKRPEDTDEEVEWLKNKALEYGAYKSEINDGFAKGGDGAIELAEAVVDACEQPNTFDFMYKDGDSIEDKITAIAKRVYGADGVILAPAAKKKIKQFTADGLGKLPVCMAKTQYSLSSDPKLLNAPTGFLITVRDIRAYTGAGFLVPLCGDIMQMPGLGKQPAAFDIDISADGEISGLF
jgi:formate--tetrahydrofolate ligase